MERKIPLKINSSPEITEVKWEKTPDDKVSVRLVNDPLKSKNDELRVSWQDGPTLAGSGVWYVYQDTDDTGLWQDTSTKGFGREFKDLPEQKLLAIAETLNVALDHAGITGTRKGAIYIDRFIERLKNIPVKNYGIKVVNE